MDNDIFDTLYRRYYAPALLYAQSLCRSRHLAEDLVQEAFCRAWLSLPDDADRRTPPGVRSKPRVWMTMSCSSSR